MKRTFIEWILIAIVLSTTSALSPSFTIGSSRALMLIALLLTLVDSGVGPLLKANNISYSFWLVGGFTLVSNTLILILLLLLVKGSSCTIGEAFLTSLIITAIERLLDKIMKNGWTK